MLRKSSVTHKNDNPYEPPMEEVTDPKKLNSDLLAIRKAVDLLIEELATNKDNENLKRELGILLKTYLQNLRKLYLLEKRINVDDDFLQSKIENDFPELRGLVKSLFDI